MAALVSCCLSAAGVRFLGILSRPGIPPLLRSAYRAADGADPSGVSMSARVRHSWGRVPSLPRGQRCLPRPGAIPGRRTPPHSGRSLSPRCCFSSRGVPITGHQQGFTDVHPSQPFPHLCSPDGTGNLGLTLSSAPGRAGPNRARQGGNEPQALPGVTSSAPLTSFNALTHRERPHVALAVWVAVHSRSNQFTRVRV